jgi:hypothetical protein
MLFQFAPRPKPMESGRLAAPRDRRFVNCYGFSPSMMADLMCSQVRQLPANQPRRGPNRLDIVICSFTLHRQLRRPPGGEIVLEVPTKHAVKAAELLVKAMLDAFAENSPVPPSTASSKPIPG